MNIFEQMMKRKKWLIPKTGYNVVGVDTFSMPGEDSKIFLIGHFDTKEEAELEADKPRSSCTRVYIYSSDTH